MTDLATMTTPASATDKEAPVEPSQEDSSQEASEETNGCLLYTSTSPTSAMTSRFFSSCSHLMHTDVSNPPEYASTTRSFCSAMTIPFDFFGLFPTDARICGANGFSGTEGARQAQNVRGIRAHRGFSRWRERRAALTACRLMEALG